MFGRYPGRLGISFIVNPDIAVDIDPKQHKENEVRSGWSSTKQIGQSFVVPCISANNSCLGIFFENENCINNYKAFSYGDTDLHETSRMSLSLYLSVGLNSITAGKAVTNVTY